jgi:beta-RFAP synthase
MPVVVSTPSRLHFGLLRFQQHDGPSFGGLGMMIAEPRWIVELQPADEWSFEGIEVERVAELATRLLRTIAADSRPLALQVRVSAEAPLHHGFGGGTQLALALAAGIRRLVGLADASAEELAELTGRGRRSAVGTYGFLQGGLIWETGRLPGETLGRLAVRIDVPESWRLVLVGLRSSTGLSGQPENDAFSALPPVPQSTTDRLMQLAEQQILPAARAADLANFGEGVYQYGRLAGECFAPVQGGPYASPKIEQCVDLIRRLGVQGVGQSSWGPTLFAFTESPQQAEWLVESLRAELSTSDAEFMITMADNRGATLCGNNHPHLAPGQ